MTSAFVAGKLREWGVGVQTGLGGTGVVGQIVIGDPSKGPRIGLRADMDALPMQEATGVPHASVFPGIMHACGHDGHTAMLLGAADLIQRRLATGELVGNGTVNFIFQPAEEVGGSDSGASRMIQDGVFERFPCDALFGIHNGPTEQEGVMYFREGPFMCGSDLVTIVFNGSSSHGATPHLARNAGLAMCATVLALHSITSQSVDPLETAILSIGQISSGRFFNVIPDRGEIRASVRFLNPETRALLHERIRTIATAQAQAFGCTAEIRIEPGYPGVINDPTLTALAMEVAEDLLGPACVVRNTRPVTASEDFAILQQHVPGTFFLIGNGAAGFSGGQPIGACSVHNPHYDFNDNILPVGAEFWAALVGRTIQQGDLK